MIPGSLRAVQGGVRSENPRWRHVRLQEGTLNENHGLVMLGHREGQRDLEVPKGDEILRKRVSELGSKTCLEGRQPKA